MKVKDIVLRDYPYITLPSTREEVLEIMRKNKTLFLPVIDSQTHEPKGILTLESFFERPDETQVALLIQRDIVTIDEECEIKEAIVQMIEKEVKNIIVTRNGKYRGILSVKCLVDKVIARMNIKDHLRHIYRESVFTIWDQTPLFIAFKIMRLAKTHVLIAINDKLMPSGILTLEDIAKYCETIKRETKSLLSAPSESEEWEWNVQTIVYIAKKQLMIPPEIKVCDAMTKKIVPVNKYTSISNCARIMSRYDYSQLPVLDAEGNLVGIIFDVDLIKAVVKYL